MTSNHATKEGGGNVAALFSEIWVADFEYRAAPGEHPWPVCMVAEDVKTGRVLRLWRNELLALDRAPFDVGPNALFVAYFASAEFSCFLELGWPLPENVVDLYAEHRNETNGEKTPCGDGLLGALALRGLAHIDAGEKDEMRRLILDQQQWTEDEKRKILDYCQSDVTGTTALFSKMATSIDWPRKNKTGEPLLSRILNVIADPLAAVGRPAPPREERPRFPGLDSAYADLLGRIGREPHASASCLFLDPISDIAILGSPGGEISKERIDAYEALTASVVPLQISDAESWSNATGEEWRNAEVPVWVLLPSGELVSCKVEYSSDPVGSYGIPDNSILLTAVDEIPRPDGWSPRDPLLVHLSDSPGMRGSPIVVADGSAIAVMDGYRSGALLTDHLPRWLLRDHARARGKSR